MNLTTVHDVKKKEVLCPGWLVRRRAGYRGRSLHCLNESTGAVWLHLPSDLHCYRNATHPCCWVRDHFDPAALSRIVIVICNAVWVWSCSGFQVLCSGSGCGCEWYVDVCDPAGNVRSPLCNVAFWGWLNVPSVCLWRSLRGLLGNVGSG